MQRSMVSLTLLVALICHAQTAPVVMLKSADLLADTAILRSAYEQLHPGLYRYNSKREMDQDFAALNRQLAHDQSLQDAFLAFSAFAAKVRCGHTQANPFNQQKALINELFRSPTRLPFYFDWLDGHMIVTRDFTPNHLLPPDTEVKKINGVPASAVLRKLLSIARADGANDSKRVAQLAVNGDSIYETFDLYYPMFFPKKSGTDTLVLVRPRSPKAEQVSVSSLTYEERIAPIKQREDERKAPKHVHS